jgi:hypothetical protein
MATPVVIVFWSLKLLRVYHVRPIAISRAQCFGVVTQCMVLLEPRVRRARKGPKSISGRMVENCSAGMFSRSRSADQCCVGIR